MRPVAITAVVLGVVHVALVPPAAAAPAAAPGAALALPGEGVDGGAGATLARAGASPFLEVPDARSSALLPVGEGGEGGRGRWRRHGYPYGYYYGWRPPPVYYAPPPPRYYRPPPVYVAPPPPMYYAPPPPVFYAPTPGVSLHFRF